MTAARFRFSYAYLVALAFPVWLALSNAEELPGAVAAIMVAGFVLLLTAVLDGVGRLVVRDPARRALAVTILLAFSLGYGHLDMLLGEKVYNQVLLPSVFLGVVVPLLWLALRARNTERIGAFVRTMAVALVGVQLLAGGTRLLSRTPVLAEGADNPVGERSHTAGAGASERPDVYLLVFDAYARQDTLETFYQHDNRAFIDALRARGFYVADQARSNYIHTRLSLASMLNMRYLDQDIRRLGPDPSKTAVEPLLRQFEVARRMRDLGYTYRHVGGYWHETRENPMADENVTYMPAFAEEFVFVFLRTTAFHPMVGVVPAYRNAFNAGLVHLKQLKSIPKPAGRRGPVFTFAHVMCPHPPFVFNRNGLLGSTDSSLVRWTHAKAYSDQVTFLNGQILAVLDEIDRVSGRDAIVLLHGDHGGRTLGHRLHGGADQIREQTSVLAAYRFPPQAAARLYPDLTLVNNFRILFGSVFGATDLPLLEDRSYYSDPDRIFDLHEVDRWGRMVGGVTRLDGRDAAVIR
jgi:hypothetical protein